MSAAPKRSRFSDKPDDDAPPPPTESMAAPAVPVISSSGAGALAPVAKVAKVDSTGPAWKLPESNGALVPLGGHGKQKLSREERRRLRKKKWSEEKVEIPGISTNMPSGLTMEQQMIYMKQLEIEEVSRRLRSNDLGIPANPEERSPSPEPVYSSDGKRLNTRDVRTRRKLEDMRHKAIQEMKEINPHYMPPADYKPPMTRVQERVLIPQDEHPGVNFVGLLIGPRGNTLKKIEGENKCKVMIRGKGSVKVQRQSYINRPLPGEDEPLHALISANSQHDVENAIKTIRLIIKDAIENPEGQNDLRKTQLMELARLNGTLREGFEPKENSWLKPENQTVTNQLVCTKCGARGHIGSDCMSGHTGNEKYVNRQMDSEYEALMAELGGGKSKGPLGAPLAAKGLTQTLGSQQANVNRLDAPPSQGFGGKPAGGLVTPDQFHQKRHQQGYGPPQPGQMPYQQQHQQPPPQQQQQQQQQHPTQQQVQQPVDPNSMVGPNGQFDMNAMMMMGMMMTQIGATNMAPPPPPPE